MWDKVRKTWVLSDERFLAATILVCIAFLIMYLFIDLLKSEPPAFECELIPAKILRGVSYHARLSVQFCNIEIESDRLLVPSKKSVFASCSSEHKLNDQVSVLKKTTESKKVYYHVCDKDKIFCQCNRLDQKLKLKHKLNLEHNLKPNN